MVGDFEVNGIEMGLGLDSAAQTLEEAYHYAYPLVLLELIRTVTTNTEAPAADKAPMNQLFHTRELASPEMTSLTRPNVDTLYSQAYVDLGQEPYVLHKPATDRFCSIQPFDGYSNTPVLLGTGGLGGNDAVTYVLTGPRFKGELPSSMTQVRMVTDFVWLLIRTRCVGPSELPVTHRIQNQFDLYPLSAHGGVHEPPRGAYDPANNLDPKVRLRAMDVTEYFNLFNQLAVRNPGTTADQPALRRFARLGIGAGLTFRLDSLSPAEQVAAQSLSSKFDQYGLAGNVRFDLVEGWVYLDQSIAQFGTNYRFRAAVADGGFASPASLAVYPSTDMDDLGNSLTGTKTYSLHFQPRQLPPHHDGGWWSISSYTETGRLVANELDRYAVSESNDLVANPDGSIDIWFGAKNPGPERESNWLPTPSNGFSVTMRIYLPTIGVNNQIWKPPQLTAKS